MLDPGDRMTHRACNAGGMIVKHAGSRFSRERMVDHFVLGREAKKEWGEICSIVHELKETAKEAPDHDPVTMDLEAL